VRNNPSNYADPSGLNPGVLALPSLGAAGGVAAAAAPYVVAYGVLWWGAWELGEWTAAQPWNRFTHPQTGCPPRVFPRVGPITMSEPAAPEKEETCAQEWERAFEMCNDHMGDSDWRHVTPVMSLYNCAKGLVSQRCGGTRVTWD
jgi:hypothetical protein